MKRRDMLKAMAAVPSIAGISSLNIKQVNAGVPLKNGSYPYCQPAAKQSPFGNIVESRIFYVDQAGNGDYTDLAEALLAVSNMERDRQNRVRIVLSDDDYYIDSVGIEGLKVPDYTRIQGNIYDKSAVQIIRATTKGRGFEIGAGSILEGLTVIIPPESNTEIPTPPITSHPVWINEAYPDPGVIQNCKLEGGQDTVIVEGGSIGFMYDVDFICDYDGIRGGFFGQTKPIRLTMVNCRGTHIGRGNTVVRTQLTGVDDAPLGSLFDIYDCVFTREYNGDKKLLNGPGGNLIGPGGEWTLTVENRTITIPLRMKNTTCRVVVPTSGVKHNGYEDFATVFLATKGQFEFENCSFEIDETLSGPQIIQTMILLEEAEGYALDCNASPPERIVNNSNLTVFIDPAL